MKKFFTLSLFLLLSGQLAMSQNTQKPAQTAHDESIEIFVTATKFLKAKKYAEASIFLDRAIAKDPSNYHFLYERGRCYLQLKNYDKALSCFKRVVDLKPDYADGHLMLGYVYMNTHKPTEAIHSYDKAFAHESSPSNRLAQKMTIIILYDRMGKLGQAEQHIADAKALHIENPLLFYYDGKLKNQHKKYKEAKEALLRAVAHLPKENDKTTTTTKEQNAVEELDLSHQDKTPAEQSKYYYELYVANYHLNYYTEAQKLAPYIVIEPYKTKIKELTVSYLYAVAYAHFMVYDLARAKQGLTVLFQKDPSHKGGHQLAVKISELETDKSMLINQLETAIEHITDEKQLWKMRHDLLKLDVEKGSYDKAVQVADEILKTKPDDHEALFFKAIALSKADKNKEALQIMQTLTGFKTLDARTLSEYEFELGLIAEKLNDYALAKDAFKHTTYFYFRAAAEEELKSIEAREKKQ